MRVYITEVQVPLVELNTSQRRDFHFASPYRLWWAGDKATDMAAWNGNGMRSTTMPHHQAFKFKSAATQIAGTLVVIFAAAIFLYASHTTVASYANSAKPVASENALPE